MLNGVKHLVPTHGSRCFTPFSMTGDGKLNAFPHPFTHPTPSPSQIRICVHSRSFAATATPAPSQ
jgi:hypothetical protein